MSTTASISTPTNVSVDATIPSGTTSRSVTGVARDELAEFNAGPVSSTAAISEQAPPPKLDPHTIDSVLTRDYLIQQINVTGSESPGDMFLPADFCPWKYVFANTKVAEAVKPFMYFRGDVRVRIVCTPPGSCYGAAIFQAICEGGYSDSMLDDRSVDCYLKDSVWNSVNDTFRVINYEQASTVEFLLPFVHYNNQIRLPITDPTYMWRLRGSVLVQLQSTISTTASATIQIYAGIQPGYTLGVAKYQMKKHVSGLDGFASRPVKVSGTAREVSNIASRLAGAIPAIAPFATPLAAGASAISSAASFFGFTRETTFATPEAYIHRLGSSIATVDGIDTGDKLVLQEGSAISIDPAIGGGEHYDPMSFESIRQRWGIVSSFTITTGVLPSRVIHSLPVTPVYAGRNGNDVYFTPGGFYGIPSTYWRGGMEYMIYIPSSPNMRGMLQVCYNPDTRMLPPPFILPNGGDPTGHVQTVSLDLSGTQQHVIKVPYAAAETMKEVVPMCDGIFVNRWANAANGSLDFFLAVPWVAPRAGPLSTVVYILARPAADMKYVQPRSETKYAGEARPEGGFQSMHYESMDDSVALFDTTILSQPLGDEFNLASVCATETFPSSRALCQKFSRAADLEYGGMVWHNFLPPPASRHVDEEDELAWIRTRNTNGYVYDQWTWMMHYAIMFTGVRGGVRYKYAVNLKKGTAGEGIQGNWEDVVETFVCQRTAQAMDYTMHYNCATHTAIQPADPGRLCEYTYPYVSTRMFRNPRSINPPPNYLAANVSTGYDAMWQQMCGVRSIANQAGYDTPMWNITPWKVRVYVAAADDFTVTRFRRVPPMGGKSLIPIP